MVGLRLVNAAGEIQTIDATERNRLDGATVALGSLGVVTQITLQLLQAYRLHERTWVQPFETCMAELHKYIDATRHFEFFWSPKEDACACKALHPTAALEPQPQTAAPSVSKRMQRYVGAERIDAAHRIFPSERNLRFNEMEFAVPAQDGPACVHEIRQLMLHKYPEVVWPIEYRTLAADQLWLSPAYQRESVTISIHQAAQLPYQQFFNDAEAIFRAYSGRPHWGKIHNHSAAELAALYPRWAEFHALRQQWDPEERFINRYLRGLFG